MTMRQRRALRRALAASLILAAQGCLQPSGGKDGGDASGACSNASGGGRSSGTYGLVATPGWSDVHDLLDESCASCHPTYLKYETAKPLAAKFVTRVKLKTTDARFMPQGGERLSTSQINLLTAWSDGGAPRVAPSPDDPSVGDDEESSADGRKADDQDDADDDGGKTGGSSGKPSASSSSTASGSKPSGC